MTTENIKGNFKMIKDMDKVDSDGKTAEYSMEIG